MNEELKSDERLMAMFSHLSIFFGAIILPVIFWAINKDKSKYISFHALQALFFHIAYFVIIVFFVLVMIFGSVGIGIITAGTHAIGHSSGPSALFIILIIAFYAVIFLIIFFFIGFSIYMAVKAYHGEYAKYPVIGNIVYRKIFSEG
jgi:uncharacterized Tic20 family protein